MDADPAPFLLTGKVWAPQRVEFCSLVGRPGSPVDALAQAGDELHSALGDPEALLAKGTTGQVRLTDDGELIVPPLTAEDVPAEADVLRTELAAMLPRLSLAPVLVEIDARHRRRPTTAMVHSMCKVSPNRSQLQRSASHRKTRVNTRRGCTLRANGTPSVLSTQTLRCPDLLLAMASASRPTLRRSTT
jgi:hypothetical protein